mmetsp:Transcript_11206/g.14922  ORF Transcript_11206/g.14922 Transcript_11206/m.14922 type:complete len:221 (-) Transcript_11206:77-739(-)
MCMFPSAACFGASFFSVMSSVTSKSSSAPVRRCSRKLPVDPARACRIRSSARAFATSSFFFTTWLRTFAIEAFSRSSIMVSTSRPWNPTSVNRVASTFTNGASVSFAKRRAISVLPHPVGPIIKIFFGEISSCMSSSTWWRRQRLRSAIATARFASGWPTINLSSSFTRDRGVMHFMSRAGLGGLSAPSGDLGAFVSGVVSEPSDPEVFRSVAVAKNRRP